MTALSTLQHIKSTNLISYDFRYCLVDSNKVPWTIEYNKAKPNCVEDFCKIQDLQNVDDTVLENFAGVGVSVQSSKITAIDIDKCCTKPFDKSSLDDRAKKIIDFFKDDCYIEFSFSGTGIRIFFLSDVIDDYSEKWYIKNQTHKIEFYQPSKSYRYVTITGQYLFDNVIRKIDSSKLIVFLDTWMKKQIPVLRQVQLQSSHDVTLEDLLKSVKRQYYVNKRFQDLWFAQAPGSNSNESELDYELLSMLYELVTQSKDMLQQVFESSPFYKSKDYHHKSKWTYGSFRYFNYLYDVISSRHVDKK